MKNDFLDLLNSFVAAVANYITMICLLFVIANASWSLIHIAEVPYLIEFSVVQLFVCVAVIRMTTINVPIADIAAVDVIKEKYNVGSWMSTMINIILIIVVSITWVILKYYLLHI